VPPGEQRPGCQRRLADGAELSHWLAGPGDGDLLAMGSPVNHLAAVVA
jgi:hypothetical protein